MYCFRAVIIKVFDGSRASGRCNGNGVNGRMPRLLDGLAETSKMRRENAGNDSLVNFYAAESAGLLNLVDAFNVSPLHTKSASHAALGHRTGELGRHPHAGR